MSQKVNRFERIFIKRLNISSIFNLIIIIFTLIFYLLYLFTNVLFVKGVYTTVIDYLFPTVPIFLYYLAEKVSYDNKKYKEFIIEDLLNVNLNDGRKKLQSLSDFSKKEKIEVKEILGEEVCSVHEVEYIVKNKKKAIAIIYEEIKIYARNLKIIFLIISIFFALGAILFNREDTNIYLLIISLYSIILNFLFDLQSKKDKYVLLRKINMGYPELDINKTINKVMPYEIYKASVFSDKGDNYLIISFTTTTRFKSLLAILFISPVLIYLLIGFYNVFGKQEKLLELLPILFAFLLVFFEEQKLIAKTDQYNVLVKEYTKDYDDSNIKMEIYSKYRTDRIRHIDIIDTPFKKNAYIFFAYTRFMQMQNVWNCRNQPKEKD